MQQIWVLEYSQQYFKIAKLPEPLTLQTPCIQRQEPILSRDGQGTSTMAVLQVQCSVSSVTLMPHVPQPDLLWSAAPYVGSPLAFPLSFLYFERIER